MNIARFDRLPKCLTVFILILVDVLSKKHHQKYCNKTLKFGVVEEEVVFCPLPLFGVAVFFPIFWVGCCGVAFSSLLLGGVVLSSSWCCQICTSPLWMVVFSPFLKELNGANELNQVAVKQSEANEREVAVSSSWVVVFSSLLCLSGGAFLPLSLWGCARGGVVVNFFCVDVTPNVNEIM